MDYKRPDGRLPNELRDVIISFDGLDGVDGSARFGFGETKAVASVSGPIEVRLTAEQASKATFEVLVRPLAGLPGTASKALASSLRSSLLPSLILTNNPRTLVQLVAQSLTPVPVSTTQSQCLRSSPAVVAALINAASLTLINASAIPLRGVVCGASVGRVRSTGGLVVDPAEDELAALDGAGTFAFLITGQEHEPSDKEPRLKAELVWSTWNATPFDEGELARAIELARAGALRVREYMKEAISQAVFGPVEVKEERMDAENITVDDAKMEIS